MPTLINFTSIEEELEKIRNSKLCLWCKVKPKKPYGKLYCKDCAKEALLKWRKENWVKFDKEYRKTEAYKIKQEKYRKSEKGKKYLKKVYQKRKSIIDNYTDEEWLKKLKESNGYCCICKKNIGIDKLTKDHIIPLNKVKEGHVYYIKDVQPICLSCNSKKQDKIYD